MSYPTQPDVILPPTATTERSLLEPPGGILMWIIVALELFAFAMVFFVIANARAAQPEMFREGQRALSPLTGIVATILLVTSGYLVAEGVHAVRARMFPRARRFYGGAVVIGFCFVALKIADYVHKVREGFTLGRSDFWDAYFLGTGFHFVHVLIGLGLLAYVGLRVGRTTFEDEETTVAGTALFWHMCDLAWFFLFPLLFVSS